MKICSCCKESKELTEFRFRKTRNSYESSCKPCEQSRNKLWHEKTKHTHADKYRERRRAYANKNKEYIKEKKTEYYTKNKKSLNTKNLANYYKDPDHKEKMRTKSRKNYWNNHEAQKKYYREYAKKTREQYTIRDARRRAKELNATPSWLTDEQKNEIKEFYSLAKELAWLNQDGKIFEVDHIVPLSHPEVCGLHVPWNLQLLPRQLNRKKSNKL